MVQLVGLFTLLSFHWTATGSSSCLTRTIDSGHCKANTKAAENPVRMIKQQRCDASINYHIRSPAPDDTLRDLLLDPWRRVAKQLRELQSHFILSVLPITWREGEVV